MLGVGGRPLLLPTLSCPAVTPKVVMRNSDLHMHIGHVFSEVRLYTHMYA